MSSENTPSIKITNFKNLSAEKQDKQSMGPLRGDYIMNVIVYSQGKALKFLDSALKEFNTSSDGNLEVYVVKCNSLSNFAYSLKTCKLGTKTLIITDQQLDQQTIKTMQQNSQALQDTQSVKIVLLTSTIQSLSPEYFHSSQFFLITTSQPKVLQYLQSQFQACKMKLNSYRSTSTINQCDKVNMEKKMKMMGGERGVIGQEGFFETGELAVSNGVPPVGKYDIKGEKFVTKGNTGFGKDR